MPHLHNLMPVQEFSYSAFCVSLLNSLPALVCRCCRKITSSSQTFQRDTSREVQRLPWCMQVVLARSRRGTEGSRYIVLREYNRPTTYQWPFRTSFRVWLLVTDKIEIEYKCTLRLARQIHVGTFLILETAWSEINNFDFTLQWMDE